jgi:pectinesterase
MRVCNISAPGRATMTSSSRPLSRGAAGAVIVAALVLPAACSRPGTTPPTTRPPTTGTPTPTPTAGPTTAPPVPGGAVDVAANGSARYRTVQAAIDAAPAGRATTITIGPGTYRGTVRIPSGKPITLRGSTGRATDVVLTEARYAQSTGSNESSSTVVNGAAGSTIADLTIANTFNRDSTSSNQDQALALTAKNDRQVYRNVRLLGHQDTFMTVTGSNAVKYRQLFTVFENSEIHSLGRSGGTVMAPSTYNTNPYGFLFVGSRFTSTSGANTIYLGRPWHPNNDPNADGQAVIRESTLGAHIKVAGPWTDMSGFSWKTEGRFREYKNTGPGAGVNANRPQLSDSQAGTYTKQAYLGDWRP